MAAPILVVDDDPAICGVVRLILEAEGYTVRVASQGQEALACLAEERPALILLDLNMPVMDGWTFHAALRARRCTLPVVFMTAGQQAAQEAVQHGAAAGLQKPFELEQLVALVHHLAA